MSAAERELRTEIEIAAPPAKVWSTLTDLDRMPDWSPELVKMLPLKRGGLRVGQWYLGINRRKGVFWPTRSVVAVLDEGSTLAWDTRTSGVRWIYELSRAGTGTRVVQRRPVPKRIPPLARFTAATMLGGVEAHADELEAGMVETLQRLKQAVEHE